MTAPIDYTMFFKQMLPTEDDWGAYVQWDVLISAFNSSERVRRIFEKAPARRKHWLPVPEYAYQPHEYPAGETFSYDDVDEAELVLEYFRGSGIDALTESICIDTTGFMRPQLAFITKYLYEAGTERADFLYGEPVRYGRREHTPFSDEEVTEIRHVSGFAGSHEPDTSRDLVIIGTGYDHELIRQVADAKDHARKVQMFGLPSLRPDFYQENVLRAERAAGAFGGADERTNLRYFAPASDPFVTAAVLREIVEGERVRGSITNLYLSPLGTKPQALGFALYYLTEQRDKATSIVFPFCKTYSRETSVGLFKVWKYTVEFAAMRRAGA